MSENPVVPEALHRTNYKRWSTCMKIYLLGQDLWDIIEPEPELQQEESSKAWRKNNALALHAINMSIGKAYLSAIEELESAKEAWDLLKSTNITEPQSDDHNSDSDPDADIEAVDSSDYEEVSIVDGIDYAPFMEAVEQGNWGAMKEFLESHPGANVGVVVDGQTALHHVLELGNTEIGGLLLDRMRDEDLEIQNEDTFTAFARLSYQNGPGVLRLLQRMVARNPKLPNIGDYYSVPAAMASWKGFKETTRYLYSVTDQEILNPESGTIGVHLFINCINIKLFDIAFEIATIFPKILRQKNNHGIYPIYALAKSMSGLKNGSLHKKSRSFRLLNDWLSKSWKHNMEHVQRLLGSDEERVHDFNLVYDKARDLLRLVCAQVSSFDESMLQDCVYGAMIEATINGSVEFVSEMLIANPNLIEAAKDGKGLFFYAVENRQEKIYNLIYSFIERKDRLLSCVNPERDNILHIVAKLPTTDLLDWRSGPASQMQREVQWFQELCSLAKSRYREDLNTEGLTPAAVFNITHKELMNAGEKVMKDAAQSSTVVGALIITIMFAAAFTVPGGNNQDDLPIFSRKGLFRIYIVCDALSLYSSIASVLAFLGILTPRYAGNEFLLNAPRKLMIGLYTLFFSLLTMMLAFCAALGLMLDGSFRYILPILFLALVPVILVMSPILPLVFETFRSTFGPSIFNKNPKLLDEIKKRNAKERRAKESEKISDNLSEVVTNSSDGRGEEKIMSSPSLDEDTNIKEESFKNSQPSSTADERV